MIFGKLEHAFVFEHVSDENVIVVATFCHLFDRRCLLSQICLTKV